MEILKAIWDFAGPWTFWIVLALIVIITTSVQTFIGKKKAKTGEDKARIHKILATVMGEGASYVPVYVRRIDTERHCERYYFYAIAMQEERMVIVPLSFADKEIGYGTPFEVRKEHLKEIQISRKMEAKTNVFNFTDKTPKKLFKLYLNAVEVCTDKVKEPVNLFQEEEALAFSKIIFRWRDELEKENQ